MTMMPSGSRLRQVLTTLILMCPLAVKSQQQAGELSGSVALASNTVKSLAVISVDVELKGKTDNIVDTGFVIVGPSSTLSEAPQGAKLRFAGDTLQYDNPFIEVIFASGRSLLIVTPSGESAKPSAKDERIVRAKKILHFNMNSSARRDHQGVAKDVLSAPIRWDATETP